MQGWRHVPGPIPNTNANTPSSSLLTGTEYEIVDHVAFANTMGNVNGFRGRQSGTTIPVNNNNSKRD